MAYIFDIEKFEFLTAKFPLANAPKLTDPLNGLFAFVAYKVNGNRLLLLSPLDKYQSAHSAINMVFNVLYKKVKLDAQFFYCAYEGSKSIEILYGGEILLLENQIIFWNCKSNCYSKGKDYDDNSPKLAEKLKETGLPLECFVSAEKAEQFAKEKLRTLFNKDGSYTIEAKKAAQAQDARIAVGLSSLPQNILNQPPSSPLICFTAGTAAG